MTQFLLAPPVFEEMPQRRIVGLMRRYTMETRVAIPQQWADYNATTPMPEPLPEGWFGVCRGVGSKGDFDYLCGVQGKKAEGQSEIRLSKGRWARFATSTHISLMGAAFEELMGHWVGQTGLIRRKGAMTEFYPPAFDGASGYGGFELWLPVE